MTTEKSLLEAVKARRTYYQLSNESTISDAKIQEIAKDALLHCPSSFNSQSTRIVVLLKKEHEQFWDFTIDVMKAMVPEESFNAHTKPRLDGFRKAYGTMLFFEDPEPIKVLQSKFAQYAAQFPVWSDQTSGMHQYMIWTALETEGLGANLQHYNPVIDQKIQNHWKIPMEWSLKAQLVFGKPVGEPAEKTFKPIEGERLFVHGA
ncbi:MAG: hypothetical protein M1827_007215 [Pycnora praestabilis]|nr:MAG: hypothetical protein M1827_007215 [Pycnora praestabilis]